VILAAQLSNKTIVSRKVLEELGAARLKESHALFDLKHYAASIYLGGQSVECYLKAAICKTLGWTELRATFRSHDLETLLVHSGLENRMKQSPEVLENFKKITELWIMDGNAAIRYQAPSRFARKDAEVFLRRIRHRGKGVASWLKRQIS